MTFFYEGEDKKKEEIYNERELKNCDIKSIGIGYYYVVLFLNKTNM